MDAQTWALTFGIAALVMLQPGGMTDRRVREVYMQRAASLCCAPPVWLFGVVWQVLYILLTANLVLFANNNTIQAACGNTYIAVFVIALVHLALAKIWLVYFNRMFARKGASLGGLVLMTSLVFGTALALLITEATCPESADIWWAIAFFLGPYALWTFYATILMGQFACTAADESAADDEDDKDK